MGRSNAESRTRVCLGRTLLPAIKAIEKSLIHFMPSRRRKVKCSGTKPCCQNCLRLNDKCQWAGQDDEEDQVAGTDKIENLVNAEQRRFLFDVFFNTPHLDIMRQSIQRLSFETTEINQLSEFLVVSIYSLSALYVSGSDVRAVFNGESASKLSQRLANIAQKYSRDTSDQPSGTSYALGSVYSADIT